jgi:hypothetical protein
MRSRPAFDSRNFRPVEQISTEIFDKRLAPCDPVAAA